MSENTKIEWCDSTFNPWTGCTKVGPGCDNSYAEGGAKRSGIVQWGPGAERRRTSAANWRKPLQWNAKPFFECVACGWRGERFLVHFDGDQCPHCCTVGDIKPARRRVFCASLADVFDNEVPVEWRADLFDLIAKTPNLDWLLVTKRIGNVGRMIPDRWSVMMPPNLWLGITVVNQVEADRDIPKLLQLKAAVRFLSMEPLLGPVDLRQAHITKVRLPAWPNPTRVDWIIVGGESGPKARPMHPEWVRGIRDQCETAGVPFLFKQHGEWLATDFCDDHMASLPSKRIVYVRRDGSFHDGSEGVDFFGGDEESAWIGKKAAGRLLDGREHNGFPSLCARGDAK